MSKRFIEIDVLRGISVILMVIFHFLFALNLFGKISVELYSGGFLVMARVIQFLFLGLAGVSLSVVWQKYSGVGKSYRTFVLKQLRRGMLIIGLGYLVTLGSLVVAPEFFVKWGVLHTIGLGIVFFSGLVGRRWWALAVAMIFMVGGFFHAGILQEFSNYPLYILGFASWGGGALDYFPIFPWFAVIGVGVFLGETLYKNFEHNSVVVAFLSKKMESLKAYLMPIDWCGRHSLAIYILHLPFLGIAYFVP
ncbi:hypothetical protein CVV38_02575 [Candidatus Peregrinibacteria bacterium HGW-Peregrinibacteria-1]|jgi:uncharacterized membrane protein|nr:MAG: hypothetical protein CVV38_02575 [Candidatus Peregrinibacteria bacterium HGW-Peregrinibacteria-1]